MTALDLVVGIVFTYLFKINDRRTRGRSTYIGWLHFLHLSFAKTKDWDQNLIWVTKFVSVQTID